MSTLNRHDTKALMRLITCHGADAADRDGRTALINATTRDDLAAVAVALEAGCDVDAADRAGLTSLHFAAMQSSPTLIALLLEHGAAVDPRDQWGNTPLARACPLPQRREAADAVRLLLKHGADPNATNHHGVAPTSWRGDDPALEALFGEAGGA